MQQNNTTHVNRHRTPSKVNCTIIQFLNAMYTVLTVPIPLPLPKVFSKTDTVFLEEMHRSVYSTVHALGLVSASAIPREIHLVKVLEQSKLCSWLFMEGCMTFDLGSQTYFSICTQVREQAF